MRRGLRGALTIAVFAVTIGSLSSCALGTVAIHSFKAQQQAAADSALKSDLANAQIAAASYAVDNNGSYSGATTSTLEAAGLTAKDTPAKFAIVVDSAGTDYCMQGTSKLGHTLHVITSGGFVTGDCPAF